MFSLDINHVCSDDMNIWLNWLGTLTFAEQGRERKEGSGWWALMCFLAYFLENDPICNSVSFSIFLILKKIWFFSKKDIQRELIIVSPRILTETPHPGQNWNLMKFFLFLAVNMYLPHIPKSAPMAGLASSSQIPGTWAFRAEKRIT